MKTTPTNLSLFIVLECLCLSTMIIPVSALADGGFVIDHFFEDVHAPDQKVVIAWDGKNETMILSTKVQSNELANLGWIIPIKSKQKPVVELADVKVFYGLQKYFTSFTEMYARAFMHAY